MKGHTEGYCRFVKWDFADCEATILMGLPAPDSSESLFGTWTAFRCEVDAREFVRRWNAHAKLVAALKEAEAMLLVAMERDLVFDEKTQRKIVANHPGMKLIRDALAESQGDAA